MTCFAVLLLAASLANWIPMRWRSGQAQSLDLLSGTPVNCILLEEPAWAPPLLREAAKRRVAALAVLHSDTTLPGQTRRAAGLDIDGVVLEGEFNESARAEVRTALHGSGKLLIELPSRSAIWLYGSDPIMGTWQGVWPGIEIEHGGTVARPTGSPWVHTNTSFLKSAGG